MVETKVAQEVFTYETRCRMCGKIHEHHFSERRQYDYNVFAAAMNKLLMHPPLLHCDRCLKETVQDVISYTPSEIHG